MKRLLAFVLVSLPMTGFAMSCPTNASIIDAGDTLQSVLQVCGQPMGQREFTRVISATEQHGEYYVVNNLQVNKDEVSLSHTFPQAVVELTYNGSRSSQNNTMVFVNNQLVNWY